MCWWHWTLNDIEQLQSFDSVIVFEMSNGHETQGKLVKLTCQKVQSSRYLVIASEVNKQELEKRLSG